MDQFHTIRSLINRKAFSLNHQQIEFVHAKFANLNMQRAQFKEAENRAKLKQQTEFMQKKEAQMNQFADQGQHEMMYQYKATSRRDASPKATAQVLYQEESNAAPKQHKRPWSGARPMSRGRIAEKATPTGPVEQQRPVYEQDPFIQPVHKVPEQEQREPYGGMVQTRAAKKHQSPPRNIKYTT